MIVLPRQALDKHRENSNRDAFSYRALLRLGSGLALVCSAGVFTALGLCFGESALASGGGGGAQQPTEDAWFTVAMPITTWLLTLLAVGWLEALGAESARLLPFVVCVCVWNIPAVCPEPVLAAHRFRFR